MADTPVAHRIETLLQRGWRWYPVEDVEGSDGVGPTYAGATLRAAGVGVPIDKAPSLTCAAYLTEYHQGGRLP